MRRMTWATVGACSAISARRRSRTFLSPIYTDWKIGVTKDVGFGVVTAAYSDTDADDAAYGNWDGENVAKGVLALSFSKSF